MGETTELFFLERVAKDIFQKHSHELQKITVILPSNRAKAYFSKYLFECAGKPTLLPNLLQMSQWVQQLSNLVTTNQMSLLLLMYEAYSNVVESPESFEAFTKWGLTALDDFNQLDSALVNGAYFFKNLRDIKDIEAWSFNSEVLTDSQKEYEKFWLELGAIYQEFGKLQESRSQYSYARINRILAEKSSPNCNETVYLVGLSSFSRAEEKWITQLSKKGNIHIIFDADVYYVNNPQHEAGLFFRKWEQNHAGFYKSNDFEKFGREIIFSKVVTPLAAAFAAAKLVNEMPESQREQTAVVLTQPQLLRPFLNALNIDSPINIALGYPIDQTSVFRTTKMLVRLWYRLTANTNKGLYYKDVLMWLSQPDIRTIISDDIIFKIQNKIAKKRWIYMREKDWKELTSEFPQVAFMLTLFTVENFNLEDVLNRLENWLVTLEKNPAFDELSKETIVRMQGMVYKMAEHAKENKFLNAVENIDILFQHYASKETVTFEGEPLEGIQVLSPQETRGVNFRNLIVVGANDDVFPGSGKLNSLIPFDLRKPYHLPLPEDKEGAVAYTFYRLIQRAETTRLIYYTQSSEYKSTEPTRYMLQVKHELADVKYKTTFREEDFVHDNQMLENSETRIHANDFSKSRIEALLENGISPSALNKFIACPLDFYYRYVIGLGEMEELEESMEAATLGIVVHYVLEKLFEPFEGLEINSSIVSNFIPQIEDLLNQAIQEKYTKDNELTGFDLITKGVARKMIENVLNFEIDRLQGKQVKIEGVEESLEVSLPMSKVGKSELVKLKGLADRIDSEDGYFHIIDFKTGKVDPKQVTYQDSDEKWLTERNTKLIQLLSYTYMWYKKGFESHKISATLFGLKQSKQGYVPLHKGKNVALVSQADMERFEHELLDVIVKMLEISEFSHNPEAKYCEFCTQ
jgi:ATP-dependent helicase/nuclease subunit B